MCFVCGEIHRTKRGTEPFEKESTECAECSIKDINRKWLRLIEARYPGSLLNICNYELWEKRDMSGHARRAGRRRAAASGAAACSPFRTYAVAACTSLPGVIRREWQRSAEFVAKGKVGRQCTFVTKLYRYLNDVVHI